MNKDNIPLRTCDEKLLGYISFPLSESGRLDTLVEHKVISNEKRAEIVGKRKKSARQTEITSLLKNIQDYWVGFYIMEYSYYIRDEVKVTPQKNITENALHKSICACGLDKGFQFVYGISSESTIGEGGTKRLFKALAYAQIGKELRLTEDTKGFFLTKGLLGFLEFCKTRDYRLNEIIAKDRSIRILLL